MGYIDNAWCGFELMLEPGNQTVKGADGTTDYFWRPPHGRQSGVLCTRSPLPIIWNNLYITWNLAFGSNQYSNWPLFFAKLLNPVVFGSYHQVDPGLYGWIWIQLDVGYCYYHLVTNIGFCDYFANPWLIPNFGRIVILWLILPCDYFLSWSQGSHNILYPLYLQIE